MLFVLRDWLGLFPLFVRLAFAAGIALGVSLLVFRVLPAGRLALQGFAETLILIRNGKKESVL
jgi:hypothetical protein